MGFPRKKLIFSSADFASDDVSTELERIENAGGSIVQGKTMISPDTGYMAIFIDSEGNRIALYSQT